jgi:hypothetical protein
MACNQAFVGLRPVFFGPGTLVRTWGTRPISSKVVWGFKRTLEGRAEKNLRHKRHKPAELGYTVSTSRRR